MRSVCAMALAVSVGVCVAAGLMGMVATGFGVIGVDCASAGAHSAASSNGVAASDFMGDPGVDLADR